MAFSGLDIYKLLPKTNCRECGFATCLAFAMQLAKKAASLDKCPYLSPEVKLSLEASSLPAIRLVTIGSGENKLEAGDETVLFRHEEKFRHPCGIGIIIDDDLPEDKLREKIKQACGLKFERVGQALNLNLIAVRQKGAKDNFLKTLKLVLFGADFGIVVMPKDAATLQAALELCKDKKPLIYEADAGNAGEFAKLAKEFKAALVICEADLDKLSLMAKDLSASGINDLFLDTGKKPIAEKLWDLTQIRRQAIKKSNRTLGYPVLVTVDNQDSIDKVIEAATYAAKYAGIILLENLEDWQAMALFTLRQNIYTDPQKPLQIEPKLYPIGAAGNNSPVLVTTNFSLSYYTVLGEVEASKVASYILSVDTEGMSVLTAWAAEKFTPEKISDSLAKSGVTSLVSHKNLVIPGYVAMMSGDLEEKSGWQIIVGPKEASGIPSFLKNL